MRRESGGASRKAKGLPSASPTSPSLPPHPHPSGWLDGLLNLLPEDLIPICVGAPARGSVRAWVRARLYISPDFSPLSGFSTAEHSPLSGFSTADDSPLSEFSTTEHSPLSGFSTADDSPLSGFSTTDDSPLSGFSTTDDSPLSEFSTTDDSPLSEFSTTDDSSLSEFSTTDDSPLSELSTAGSSVGWYHGDCFSLLRRPNASRAKRVSGSRLRMSSRQ